MARPRRDLQRPAPVADPEWTFRWLRTVGMNTEPLDPRSTRIHHEADAIKRRGGSPEKQLLELREFVDGLGLRAAGEKHIAYLTRVRERRQDDEKR